MTKYQEALNRISSIDLDRVLDLLGGEEALSISIYGIHDYPNLEMSGDIETLQELIDNYQIQKIMNNKGENKIISKEEIENIDIKLFEKLWEYAHKLQQENQKQKGILDILKQAIIWSVNHYSYEPNELVLTMNTVITEDHKEYDLLEEWLDND